MDRTGTITMAMQDLDRLKVIGAVVDGNLQPSRAAQRLGLTDRQVRRLVNRVKENGAAGIVSRRRGRPSNNHLPQDLTKIALNLIRARYADFGLRAGSNRWQRPGLV